MFSGLPPIPKGSSDSSRFTPLTVMVMFIAILIFVGLSIWATLKYNASGSTPVIVTIVGFAILMMAWLFGVKAIADNTDAIKSHAAQATQAVIEAKTTRAELTSAVTDIQTKVNGGCERALNALREQHRIAMHDKDNELNGARMKYELSEAECKKVREELIALKAKQGVQ